MPLEARGRTHTYTFTQGTYTDLHWSIIPYTTVMTFHSFALLSVPSDPVCDPAAKPGLEYHQCDPEVPPQKMLRCRHCEEGAGDTSVSIRAVQVCPTILEGRS